MTSPELPFGFSPSPALPQPATSPPAEAHGVIGEKAASYGIGTKADGEIPATVSASEAGLMALPPADPSWTAEEVAMVEDLSARAAVVGGMILANLWRRNVARPRESYMGIGMRLDALERVVTGMERAAAGRGATLPRVEPVMVVRSIFDLPALDRLAETLGNVPAGTWAASSLGLVTDAVRRAWAEREAGDPPLTATPRNLFEWASPAVVHLGPCLWSNWSGRSGNTPTWGWSRHVVPSARADPPATRRPAGDARDEALLAFAEPALDPSRDRCWGTLRMAGAWRRQG